MSFKNLTYILEKVNSFICLFIYIHIYLFVNNVFILFFFFTLLFSKELTMWCMLCILSKIVNILRHLLFDLFWRHYFYFFYVDLWWIINFPRKIFQCLLLTQLLKSRFNIPLFFFIYFYYIYYFEKYTYIFVFKQIKI